MGTSAHATSVERALAILEFLDGARRGWNISEISRKLQIPKSSTHVLVRTLERQGYLKREPGSRGYTLGLKLYGLGRGVMRNLSLPSQALPAMRALSEQTGLTVHLAVLDVDQAIYIQKVEAPGLIRFDTYIGKRTNLHCTAIGKALLAYTTWQRQQRFLSRGSFARYTKNSITTAAALRQELQRIRQRGYAIDDEEEELQIRCVAAPVLDSAGELVAAIGVTGTTGQVQEGQISWLGRTVRQAANRILQSQSAGGGWRTAAGMPADGVPPAGARP